MGKVLQIKSPGGFLPPGVRGWVVRLTDHPVFLFIPERRLVPSSSKCSLFLGFAIHAGHLPQLRIASIF